MNYLSWIHSRLITSISMFVEAAFITVVQTHREQFDFSERFAFCPTSINHLKKRCQFMVRKEKIEENKLRIAIGGWCGATGSLNGPSKRFLEAKVVKAYYLTCNMPIRRIQKTISFIFFIIVQSLCACHI